MGKKSTLTVLLLALLFVAVLASTLDVVPLTTAATSTPPAVEWSQTYDSGSTDRAWSVQPTSDGGYILAGECGGMPDAWLVKTNSTGDDEWDQTYGGSGWDSAYSVQQTSDGGYIMAGTTTGDTLAWLVKTDSTGNTQWSKTYGGQYNFGEAYSVQQTHDGGYIIAGRTAVTSEGGCAWLFKIDSAGGTQWSKTYNGGGTDAFAYSVEQTSDGGYVFAGTFFSYPDVAVSFGFWLVKTSSAGAVEWSQIYGKGVARSVQQTNDGGYIVAGHTSPNGFDPLAEDAWVIKTNSTGGLQWSKTIGGTHIDEFWSVGLTSGGGYILGGVNVGIVKMNSTGAVEWNQTYGGSHAYSVQQTHDGGYIAAGVAPSPVRQRDTDLWLMKLEADYKDTDGDGLLDDWEKNGIDYNSDGITDLDLPALGADWRHKDLFVEVDHMQGHYPDPDAMTDVESAFANAPVTNPDGIPGIRLHIDVDEQIPHQDLIKEDFTKEFDSLKDLYFGTAAQRSGSNSLNVLDAKKLVYRYCIFVHKISHWNGTHDVETNYAGLGEMPGNDFIIAAGSFVGGLKTTRDDHAGGFMHELGHNLGLHHGGDVRDEINFKPNYLSVMNYAFCFSTLVPWRPLDYSRKELPTLYEGSLVEPYGIQASGFWQYTIWNNSKRGRALGFADGPLDWNGDGNFSYMVRANINNFTGWGYNSAPDEVLKGYNDWANVKLAFGNTDQFEHGAHIHMSGEEITSDTVEAMRRSVLAMHEVAVFNVTSPSSVWGQGGASSVTFTLGNFGGSDENVNATVYANSTLIASSSLMLKAGNLTTVTFPCNGQILAAGNYRLSAAVSLVAQESYTADNTATGGVISVTTVIPEVDPAAFLAVIFMVASALALVFRKKAKPQQTCIEPASVNH